MKNSVSVIGRVGKDPELRNLDSGKKVCTFSVAVTEKWKTEQGEQKEHTEWINCVSWGKQGEAIAKYVHKGHMFAVDGKLRTRMWEKEGQKHYTTELLVENFYLLPNGPKPENSSSPMYGDSPRNSVTSNSNVGTDDLPF